LVEAEGLRDTLEYFCKVVIGLGERLGPSVSTSTDVQGKMRRVELFLREFFRQCARHSNSV